jgi:hypothetical protein
MTKMRPNVILIMTDRQRAETIRAVDGDSQKRLRVPLL